MSVNTSLAGLSQTASSNGPDGSVDPPSTVDDAIRYALSFIATLRDGKGFTTPVVLASAGTCDIGAQNAMGVEISGTTTITSFGTNYNGPRFLRFTGALTLTHNASTLILPGGGNITTEAGDCAVVVPKTTAGTADGWQVIAFQRGSTVDVPPGPRNRLINGEFLINQALPATSADDTYAHDQWYALTQTGTIAVSTVADAEDGTPYMARLTQSQASAQRMGYAQIIEGKHCRDLRGKRVTFRLGRTRLSSSANVRYAVLEWTGTQDSVTSDVVNDWTSSTYTAGNFFNSTTLTVSGVLQQALTAGTLTDGSSLTVTLGSSFNNLIVFAWTEGTAAQNVTFDLAKAQIELGTATKFEFRPYATELALCQRYYAVTFPPGTAPAQNVTPGVVTNAVTSRAQTGNWGVQIRWNFPVPMRSHGTSIAITTYNPAAANANIRDNSAAGDISITQTDVSSNSCVNISSSASATAGNLVAIHLAADCRL